MNMMKYKEIIILVYLNHSLIINIQNLQQEEIIIMNLISNRNLQVIIRKTIYLLF